MKNRRVIEILLLLMKFICANRMCTDSYYFDNILKACKSCDFSLHKEIDTSITSVSGDYLKCKCRTGYKRINQDCSSVIFFALLMCSKAKSLLLLTFIDRILLGIVKDLPVHHVFVLLNWILTLATLIIPAVLTVEARRQVLWIQAVVPIMGTVPVQVFQVRQTWYD